jgi:hypothetical protein
VAGALAADSPDNVGGADVDKLVGSFTFADALTGNAIANVLDDGAIGNNVDAAADTLNGLGGDDLRLAHGGGGHAQRRQRLRPPDGRAPAMTPSTAGRTTTCSKARRAATPTTSAPTRRTSRAAPTRT